jgi:ketosteroid isomerase-like protein
MSPAEKIMSIGSLQFSRRKQMRRVVCIFAGILIWGSLFGAVWAQGGDERAEILKVRETVWRAWFANDTKTLEKLVPPDTIVISAGEEKWKNQSGVFQSAADFQKDGGKLIRLEFPRTEIQRFGDVAIVWSSFVLETETNGKRSSSSGRVTEVFVRRNGQWVNPGWHTDSEK